MGVEHLDKIDYVCNLTDDAMLKCRKYRLSMSSSDMFYIKRSMKIRTYIITLTMVIMSFLTTIAQKLPYFANVDSIELKLLHPTTMFYVPIAYDRTHFDKIFDDYYSNGEDANPAYRFCIKDSKEKMYFINTLKYLNKYEGRNSDPKPGQVKTKEWANWREQPYQVGGRKEENPTNDPMSTRGKIILHLKDGAKIECFWSPTLVEIFDERFETGALSGLIDTYLWDETYNELIKNDNSQ